MKSARTIARLLFIAFTLIMALGAIELLLTAIVHVPRLTAAAPAPVRRLAQQVYRHFNRSLIQFDEHCARYDPDVTYTLRPGRCTFSNIEFTTAVDVNRLGLRSTDAALDGPEVIVLGDSHAMGWGVQQDESFPEVLARATGRKVLNAGISSYATVREMRLFDRLDASKLRVIVLQYADNDVVENRTFKDDGDRLPITAEERYRDIGRYYSRQQTYYPGKYLFRLTMKLTRLETPEPDQLPMAPASIAEEVSLFLNALAHAGKAPHDQVPMVVLEVNQDLGHIHAFTTALADALKSGGPALPRITPFDASAVLQPGDFYVLDDHMTAKGHRALGEALAPVVRGFF